MTTAMTRMYSHTEAKLAPRPRPEVAALRPYVRRPSHDRIDVCLDANEGPSPGELTGLLARIDPELLRRYPDASALEERLAAHFGVAPSQVLATAGADEAIDRLCRAFLQTGDELILPSPGFEMIRHYGRLSGAEVIEPSRRLGASFPVDSVLQTISPHTRIIAVVSPDNPTGAVAHASDLRLLSAVAPTAILMVDLAYVDFAEVDLTPAALALPNAVVLRTFSKAWGLAGLRVGCAIGPESIIAALRVAGGPYSVAGPSLWLAAAALDQPTQPRIDFIQRVRREREVLQRVLHDHRIQALPSQANFVLARFDDAARVAEAVADRGIAVRQFAADSALARWLRISCPGNPETFDRLVTTFRQILAGETHQ